MLADVRLLATGRMALREFSPNVMQLAVARAILVEGAKNVFVRAGRKAGKTEGCGEILDTIALSVPGQYYYVTPYQKMAREILWEPRRLQERIRPELYDRVVLHEDNQGMRFSLCGSGGLRSFVKLDGSDNYIEWEGINPDGVVLDEFRLFKRQFFSVMNPNRASKDAWCLIIGSTPETENDEEGRQYQYWEIWDEWSERERQGDRRYRCFHFDSYVNDRPGMREWLNREKERLYSIGKGVEWQIRYEAARVEYVEEMIFPPGVFDEPRIVRDKHELRGRVWELLRTPGRCECLLVTDPASGSKAAWAALYLVWDKWARKVYVLSEEAERDRTRMSVGVMWPHMREKACLLFGGHEYTVVYDGGARWFFNEVLGIDKAIPAFINTNKSFRTVTDGCALIADMFREGIIEISSDCNCLLSEIKTFTPKKMGDRRGKGGDDCLDCLRYGIDHWRITLEQPDIEAMQTRKSALDEIEKMQARERREEEAEMQEMLNEIEGEAWNFWE